MAAPIFQSSNWRSLPVSRVLDALAEDRRAKPRHGPGQRLAVVVVDMQRGFLPEGDSVAEAVLSANAVLLRHARARGLPVFLVRIVHERLEDLNPALLARYGERLVRPRHDPAAQLHPHLGVSATDIVIEKRQASAFVGTRLDQELRARNIDTILLTGTSTSGCVRATAVDGASLSYRVLLIEDGVYEPRPLSGELALWDLAERYADVIPLAEALAVIDLEPDGFRSKP
jgi:maleamate amidohydrolase